MSNYLVYITGVPGDGALRTVGGTAQATIRCSSLGHGIDIPILVKGPTRKPGFSLHGSIYLTHALDKATPKLRQAAANKDALGEVHIFRTEVENGTTVDAETIKLGQCRLADVAMDTGATSEGPVDMPSEAFALDYEEIVWDFRHVNNGVAATITGGWDTDHQRTITAVPEVST